MENFNPLQFLQELNQFNGTELYYKHSLTPLLYTDGILFFADTLSAHWLIDFIALRVTNIREFPFLLKHDFLTIRILCHESQAIVCFDDGNYNFIYSEIVDFTDFRLNHFKMYYENGVLCLPTER